MTKLIRSLIFVLWISLIPFLISSSLGSCKNGGDPQNPKQPTEQTEPPTGQDFNPVNVTPELLNFNVDNIVVEGDLGYATARFNGLYILDMKNPAEPKPLKNVDTPGYGVNLAVSDGYAYIADGEEGIQVIDVDPVDEASIVGSLKTPTPAKDAAVAGKLAYVACGGGWEDKNGSIEIVDIGDPKSPKIIKSVPTGGEAKNVKVQDGYAYVCDGRKGFFKILDIAPPESAKIIGTLEITVPNEVAVSGNLACVTDGNGLHVIDITTPESPSEIRFIDISSWVSGVVISGDYAFVAAKDGIYPVKIVRPELGRIGDPAQLACGASAISIFENYIFVPNSTRPPTMNLTWIQDGNSGFAIVDIKSPLSPSVAGSANVLGNCKFVAVNGKNACTVNSTGFSVVDIDTPEKAKLAGSYIFPLPEQVNKKQPMILRAITGVEAQGKFAYVADDNAGIMIFNTSKADSPKLVKTLDTPGQIKTGEFGYYQVDSTKRKAQRMRISGGYAYLIVNDRTFAIANIDPPESAEVIATLELPGESNEMRNFNAGMPVPELFIDGAKAYVTEYVYGDRRLYEGEGSSAGITRITSIDIADPKSPSIVEKIDLPNVGNVLAISQGRVYLSFQESEYESSQGTESLRSMGYIGGEGKSVCLLEIYDLNGSDKTKPIGSVETEGVISPARIVGPYLYANIYGKMSIIKIDPPEKPEIVKSFEPGVIGNDFDVYNGYLYIADDRTGLSIFKLW